MQEGALEKNPYQCERGSFNVLQKAQGLFCFVFVFLLPFNAKAVLLRVKLCLYIGPYEAHIYI